MAFTCKHYEQIAQILRENYMPDAMTEWSKGNNSAIDMIVADLNLLLMRDNPAFDPAKFRARVQGE